jgi:hypothetical protein
MLCCWRELGVNWLQHQCLRACLVTPRFGDTEVACWGFVQAGAVWPVASMAAKQHCMSPDSSFVAAGRGYVTNNTSRKDLNTQLPPTSCTNVVRGAGSCVLFRPAAAPGPNDMTGNALRSMLTG